MAKKETNFFTYKDSKGKETKYEILFEFDSNETNKSYIVYTDNTTDAEGLIKTYASIYIEEDDRLQLIPIEDEKEWNLVEKLFSQAIDEIEED